MWVVESNMTTGNDSLYSILSCNSEVRLQITNDAECNKAKSYQSTQDRNKQWAPRGYGKL